MSGAVSAVSPCTALYHRHVCHILRARLCAWRGPHTIDPSAGAAARQSEAHGVSRHGDSTWRLDVEIDWRRGVCGQRRGGSSTQQRESRPAAHCAHLQWSPQTTHAFVALRPPLALRLARHLRLAPATANGSASGRRLGPGYTTRRNGPGESHVHVLTSSIALIYFDHKLPK